LLHRRLGGRKFRRIKNVTIYLIYTELLNKSEPSECQNILLHRRLGGRKV
jgi:hypothetical protein